MSNDGEEEQRELEEDELPEDINNNLKDELAELGNGENNEDAYGFNEEEDQQPGELEDVP